MTTFNILLCLVVICFAKASGHTSPGVGRILDVWTSSNGLKNDNPLAKINNVNDSSLCCQRCQANRRSSWTQMFNYRHEEQRCECIVSDRYGPVVDIYSSPGVTSGLCDTEELKELTRRAGFGDDFPYSWTDVQGVLGEGRAFKTLNLDVFLSVYEDYMSVDGVVDHSVCCEECIKKNPQIQIYEYSHDRYKRCECYAVIEGTRPVTVHRQGFYAGICDGAMVGEVWWGAGDQPNSVQSQVGQDSWGIQGR